MAEHTGNSALFGIFILSIYSLFLIPFTIYRLCSASSEEESAQPWQGKKKPTKMQKMVAKLTTKGNIFTILLWVVWFAVLFYVQAKSSDFKVFDPYEILNLERGATEKEIKKAYRQMSLKFHPDKNPDPAAGQFFAEYIVKAYKTLTDTAARENYEKYGHPDGPQGIDVGVALPEFFFTKDSKSAPLMLLALVGGGILLPLSIVSWYILSSKKYTGPNGIMNETMYFYMHPLVGIKESQSLARIPETLMTAMEFITLPTPNEHSVPMEELRKQVLRWQPELKEKPKFWQRKASVLKADMLLRAHLERESDEVAPILQPDLKFVLSKTPILLEEMIKIAAMPRPPHGYGWFTPAQAVVEMMQCVSQALPISSRKAQGKSQDAVAPLLQLPGMDSDGIKKLKRRKVNNFKEFMELSAEEKGKALEAAGLDAQQVEESLTLAGALPTLTVHNVSCFVDGEEEIIEGDVTKCKATVLLSRASHQSEEELDIKGKAVKAYTPCYPVARDEQWWVLLADVSGNSLLAFSKVNLREAEGIAFEHPEWLEQPAAQQGQQQGQQQQVNGSKEVLSIEGAAAAGAAAAEGGSSSSASEDGSEPGGQAVELLFMAPKAGKMDLQLFFMSENYVGCDKSLPLKIKVNKLTRAMEEGRDARSKQAAKAWQSEDEEEEGDEEGSDDEGSGADYDSEESGELESGDEEEEGSEGSEDMPELVADDKKTK